MCRQNTHIYLWTIIFLSVEMLPGEWTANFLKVRFYLEEARSMLTSLAGLFREYLGCEESTVDAVCIVLNLNSTWNLPFRDWPKTTQTTFCINLLPYIAWQKTTEMQTQIYHSLTSTKVLMKKHCAWHLGLFTCNSPHSKKKKAFFFFDNYATGNSDSRAEGKDLFFLNTYRQQPC